MAGVLRVVLGDQLSLGVAALDGLAAADTVLMAEVLEECTYVKHHKKKLVLVLSAMRHFAATLRDRGVTLRYVALDDPANTHTLAGEVARAVAAVQPVAVIATQCGEWRVAQSMRGWATEIRDDRRFFCATEDFRAWAAGKTHPRMEFFYREMRRATGLLMDEQSPVGGAWNFDAENRKRLPRGLVPPPTPAFPPDRITQDVMALVDARFADHFGDTTGFTLAVTAEQAETAFDDFIAHRLENFGDWQDAMKTGETALFHALISTSLNLGLLDPRKICARAEAAYRASDAPLNAVEGFIRQILGWREFVRGIYWLHMPQYATRNALGAGRRLPWFYWSGETRMNCLHQAITQTRDHAYAHHIQRLMITGNFALLAGLDPDQVDDWYMVVYADAYQWVELPNTRGMALHADGGVIGSKPYAASGAYINRMSDYCMGCTYDVKRATGEGACPFNSLYWNFIARHATRLAGNTRMAMPVRSWEKMDRLKKEAITDQARYYLNRIEEGLLF